MGVGHRRGGGGGGGGYFNLHLCTHKVIASGPKHGAVQHNMHVHEWVLEPVVRVGGVPYFTRVPPLAHPAPLDLHTSCCPMWQRGLPFLYPPSARQWWCAPPIYLRRTQEWWAGGGHVGISETDIVWVVWECTIKNQILFVCGSPWYARVCCDSV